MSSNSKKIVKRHMSRTRVQKKKNEYDWDTVSISVIERSVKMEEKTKWMNRMIFMIVFVLIFLLITWFVQLAWNYTVPKLIESVQKDYNANDDFQNIDYSTALVLTILVLLLFGGMWRSHTCDNACCR